MTDYSALRQLTSPELVAANGVSREQIPGSGRGVQYVAPAQTINMDRSTAVVEVDQNDKKKQLAAHQRDLTVKPKGLAGSANARRMTGSARINAGSQQPLVRSLNLMSRAGLNINRYRNRGLLPAPAPSATPDVPKTKVVALGFSPEQKQKEAINGVMQLAAKSSGRMSPAILKGLVAATFPAMAPIASQLVDTVAAPSVSMSPPRRQRQQFAMHPGSQLAMSPFG